jgi:hypothetical protein
MASIVNALQAELQQEVESLRRENKLITSAWYDMTSRLQSNTVILQRKSEAPRSWLGKQRVAVGNGSLVSTPFGLYFLYISSNRAAGSEVVSKHNPPSLRGASQLLCSILHFEPHCTSPDFAHLFCLTRGIRSEQTN